MAPLETADTGGTPDSYAEMVGPVALVALVALVGIAMATLAAAAVVAGQVLTEVGAV